MWISAERILLKIVLVVVLVLDTNAETTKKQDGLRLIWRLAPTCLSCYH